MPLSVKEQALDRDNTIRCSCAEHQSWTNAHMHVLATSTDCVTGRCPVSGIKRNDLVHIALKSAGKINQSVNQSINHKISEWPKQ